MNKSFLKQDINKYMGGILTSGTLALMFILQFVSFGASLASLKSPDFWSNFGFNLLIVVSTYAVWLEDAKGKAVNNPLYRNTEQRLGTLMAQLMKKGRLDELKQYAEEQDKIKLATEINKRILATGVSVETFEKEYRLMDKKELREKGLSKRQQALILKAQKPVELKATDITYLLTDESSEQMQSLEYSEKRAKARKIVIKCLKFSVWAALLASLVITKKETSLVVVLFWIFGRLFGMLLALRGGIQAGKELIINEKRSVLKYRICFLISFFAWDKKVNNFNEWVLDEENTEAKN